MTVSGFTNGELNLATITAIQGTWTPTVGGSGGGDASAYTNQLGNYYKIGDLVIASFHVTWTAGASSGNLQIKSLPFAAATAITNNQWQAIQIAEVSAATSSCGVEMVAGATTHTVVKDGLTSNNAAVAWDSAGEMRATFVYLTD